MLDYLMYFVLITYCVASRVLRKDHKIIHCSTSDIRNQIFRLSCEIGHVSALIQNHTSNKNYNSSSWTLPQESTSTFSNLLFTLIQISNLCKVNLLKAITAKISLNAKKYPVYLCKVSYLPKLTLIYINSFPKLMHDVVLTFSYFY